MGCFYVISCYVISDYCFQFEEAERVAASITQDKTVAVEKLQGQSSQLQTTNSQLEQQCNKLHKDIDNQRLELTTLTQQLGDANSKCHNFQQTLEKVVICLSSQRGCYAPVSILPPVFCSGVRGW